MTAAIHAVGLDLLDKFSSACDAMGLRYSLSSGSLLGAVRHGGF
ncbi:MAG: LicD family protein, partial [Clostridia bacterium]|nr:LicD family protein [Clostridia bacterium]